MGSDAAATLTAGWQKVFSPDPKLGFLSHAESLRTSTLPTASRMIFNDRLDAALALFFMAVVIVVVALILHLASGVDRFPPSAVSKVNTAVQVIAVLLVLLSGISPGFDLPATVAIYLVAALTLASGIDYIYRSNRMVSSR